MKIDIENVMIALMGMVAAVVLTLMGVLIYQGYRTDKDTVQALEQAGYKDVSARSIAGSHLYLFRDTAGRIYLVGQNYIGDYTNK